MTNNDVLVDISLNDVGVIQEAVIDREVSGTTTTTVALSGEAQNINVAATPAGFLRIKFKNKLYKIAFYA